MRNDAAVRINKRIRPSIKSWISLLLLTIVGCSSSRRRTRLNVVVDAFGLASSTIAARPRGRCGAGRRTAFVARGTPSTPPTVNRMMVVLKSSASGTSSSSDSSATKKDEIGYKISMPSLSKTMTKGRILMWYKDEGDYLEAGDSLLVVDTDKADVETETYQQGYIAQILAEEGEIVQVGDPIALISLKEEDMDLVVEMFDKNPNCLKDAVAAGQ